MTLKAKACNFDAIVARGAVGGNADFEMYKCKSCGSYALYDAETLLIYMNSNDLHKNSIYAESTGSPGDFNVKCLTCGATNSFDEASDEDYNKVLNSPWAFVLEEGRSTLT